MATTAATTMTVNVTTTMPIMISIGGLEEFDCIVGSATTIFSPLPLPTPLAAVTPNARVPFNGSVVVRESTLTTQLARRKLIVERTKIFNFFLLKFQNKNNKQDRTKQTKNKNIYTIF